MKITPDAERIVDRLCLMDDTLFRTVAEDVAFCEEILKVILQKGDLKVLSVQVQKDFHHVKTHSVVLDVLCTDSENKRYNIEVQQEDNDDHQKRVRYHVACIDTTIFEKGQKYAALPEVCVIYISRFDIFKKGRTIYHIDRTIRETNDVVDNGLHEVYVNTQIDDASDIAALMKIFKSTEVVQDKRFQIVCARLREYKEGKGRVKMCQLVEEYAREIARETQIETAKKAFAMGMTLENVGRIVSLSEDDLKKIELEVCGESV